MESQELTLDDGRKLVIRMGRLEDLDRIRKLYTDIYGNAYTIPEIADPVHAHLLRYNAADISGCRAVKAL